MPEGGGGLAALSANNVPGTLRRLKGYFSLTDKVIATATGLPRSTVNSRIAGSTACTAADVLAFAAFFGVPVDVLYMDPDDALRWVLDHPSDLLSRDNSCSRVLAGSATAA